MEGEGGDIKGDGGKFSQLFLQANLLTRPFLGAGNPGGSRGSYCQLYYRNTYQGEDIYLISGGGGGHNVLGLGVKATSSKNAVAFASISYISTGCACTQGQATSSVLRVRTTTS